MKLIHSFQTRIAGSLFLLMLVVITLVYLTVKAARYWTAAAGG